MAGRQQPGAATPAQRGRVALRTLTADRDGIAALVAVLCDGVSRAPRPDLASDAAADAGAAALAAALRAGQPGRTGRTAGRTSKRRSAARRPRRPTRSPISPAAAAARVTGVHVRRRGRRRRVGHGGLDRGQPGLLAAQRAGGAGSGSPRTTRGTPRPSAHGRMSAAAAAADRRAHALTAWLGVDHPDAAVHIETLRPSTPGVLVLCTGRAVELPHDARRDRGRPARGRRRQTRSARRGSSSRPPCAAAAGTTSPSRCCRWTAPTPAGGER